MYVYGLRVEHGVNKQVYWDHKMYRPTIDDIVSQLMRYHLLTPYIVYHLMDNEYSVCLQGDSSVLLLARKTGRLVSKFSLGVCGEWIESFKQSDNTWKDLIVDRPSELKTCKDVRFPVSAEYQPGDAHFDEEYS
jgi:hypothetical protein